MGSRTPKAGHVPRVDDLEFPFGNHRVAIALVEQFIPVVEAYRGAEDLRVVDAARELPLAGHAPTVPVPFGRVNGRRGTRHDGHRVGDQLGTATREPGADQSERLDADHQVPAGAAVGPGRGFDDSDLRHGIRIGTVDVPGAGEAIETVPGKGLGDRLRQVSNPFRFVGVAANQGRQAFGCSDVVRRGHANECNPPFGASTGKMCA